MLDIREGMGPIRDFTELVAWQKTHQLVLKIYKTTASFPEVERFGLTIQVRRSASSAAANLAEGYGRYHPKDKIRFFHHARGSLTETRNHLILAHNLDLLDDKNYQQLDLDTQECIRLTNGLIKATNQF